MIYRYLLSLFILFAPFMLCAQNDLEASRTYWIDTEERDFSKIQEKMNTWYEDRDQGRGSGYKQWKRWEYRMKDKLDQDGRLVNVAARNFQAAKEYYSQKSSVVHTGDWSFVAPNDWVNGNQGYNPGNGRVNCIGFHPTDVNTFYIGTPFGGIWKTTDQGSTWAPLHDGLPSLGVSGIAVHPTNPDTIYILTGDGDGNDTPGVGVLKTYDGGITWMETGLSWTIDQNERGYRLVMDPNDPDIMLAGTTEGILRTTDGWDTWTQEASGTYRDVEYKPGASNIAYAERQSGQFYRTVDGGLNWTQVTNGVPGSASRLAIGVSPDDVNVVYFVAGPTNGAGTFRGLYYSDDQGQSFSLLNDTPNILGYSSSGSDNNQQSWYDLAIAVHPTDADRLYTGGINIWKKVNPNPLVNITQWVYGGSQYTHADIHMLEYNPLNNYLYCGSDGGIFQSADGGDSWTDISAGIANMQFYKISGTPQDASLLVGGTQDNGTNKWSGGNAVTHIYGADGMDNMISFVNSDTIYFSFQSGGFRKSNNGGNNCFGIKPSGANGSWVTPMIMDPTNSHIIYGGFSDVYKSTDGGASWSNMGADGRTAMAIGTNNPQRLYAAIGSTLRTSSNGGTNWSDVSGPWGGQSVTGITVDPDDANKVYVTVNGFNASSKVYRSTNAGSSWVNETGSLPNTPHNCIIFEDTNGSPANAVYVGTDIGVFYRNDDLGDWIPFTNGLPTVEVRDMEIHYGSSKIRAATYGRSIWESDLYTVCPPFYVLTPANNPGATDVSVGYQLYEASNYVESTRLIGGGIGTNINYQAGSYIDLNAGFTVRKGAEFLADIGPCTTAPAMRQEGEDVTQESILPLVQYVDPENVFINYTAEKEETLEVIIKDGEDELYRQQNVLAPGFHRIKVNSILEKGSLSLFVDGEVIKN